MTTVDPRRPTGADEARSIARNMAHGIRYMAQATGGGGRSRFPCARVVRRPASCLKSPASRRLASAAPPPGAAT